MTKTTEITFSIGKDDLFKVKYRGKGVGLLMEVRETKMYISKNVLEKLIQFYQEIIEEIDKLETNV